MTEVEHGFCTEFSVREMGFYIEGVSPCVILASETVGTVECVGSITLLITEVVAIAGLPTAHRRQVLTKSVTKLHTGVGIEMVGGCMVVLAVGLSRSLLHVLVGSR